MVFRPDVSNDRRQKDFCRRSVVISVGLGGGYDGFWGCVNICLLIIGIFVCILIKIKC